MLHQGWETNEIRFFIQRSGGEGESKILEINDDILECISARL